MEFSTFAKENLLNWDHDVNPTSLKDMAANIHDLIAKGFESADMVRVALNKKELVIEVMETTIFSRGSSFGRSCIPNWKRVVHADLSNATLPREHIGRVGTYLPVNVYALADYVKTAC